MNRNVRWIDRWDDRCLDFGSGSFYNKFFFFFFLSFEEKIMDNTKNMYNIKTVKYKEVKYSMIFKNKLLCFHIR